MAEQRAVVVEVGPMAWFDEINKGAPPRAKVGDKVIFAKHSGYGVLGDDGVTYRCVNDRDIFMRVES
jgi:co-chaperonin GroES (HSP10)